MGVGKNRVTSIETSYMKQQEVLMKRKAKRKKLLIRRLSLFLVLTIALSYFVISFYISRLNILEAKQAEQVKLEHQLAKLEKEQKLLENEIAKLNDDEYIAKLARSEYFLSDEGEIIFTIPESKKKEDKDEEEDS
ncbi:FtsB family cell division protein [Lederbergia graminis]|uniref:Septum formation initiator family protein n=1 Tax=Lederbergia graminis TaxID=735518 RepID=A0ABW0LG78_9BACI|nr:septum formation initiator family protein [Paenibacillus bovis]